MEQVPSLLTGTAAQHADPDLTAVYVNDYAQHRVVECFYNGTCRDFVQKGSGGLKWPWCVLRLCTLSFTTTTLTPAVTALPGVLTSVTTITVVAKTLAGMTVTNSMLPARVPIGESSAVLAVVFLASLIFCPPFRSIILYNAANGVLKKSPFAIVPGSPRGVKYFRQSIYVASYHNHAIYRFNARTGAPQGKFTHGGPTLFRPLDLEFDPFGRDGLGGNLYVSSQNSVFQYERHSGSFINQWSKDLRLNSVAGISFRRNDPTNKNMFVTGPYMGKVWVELKERNCTEAVGGTYCPDNTQATGEYVKRQEDEYLKAPVGVVAHPVPKKLGTMVVGARQELFVADKDEIRRYDGNTGEFISVYARYDGMDATFMHFNQLDQQDCYGASCPVQTCNQCAILNTINSNKQN